MVDDILHKSCDSTSCLDMEIWIEESRQHNGCLSLEGNEVT